MGRQFITMDASVKQKMLEDIRQRVHDLIRSPPGVSVYFQNRPVEPGESIDLTDSEIAFDQAVHYAFVDEQPGYNWGHACRYLVYEAEHGRFLAAIEAHFPPGFPAEGPGLMESVEIDPHP